MKNFITGSSSNDGELTHVDEHVCAVQRVGEALAGQYVHSGERDAATTSWPSAVSSSTSLVPIRPLAPIDCDLHAYH